MEIHVRIRNHGCQRGHHLRNGEIVPLEMAKGGEISPRLSRVPMADGFYCSAAWHFLYFFPDPQGQGSLRPTFSPVRRCVGALASPAPAKLAASNSRCFLR